MDDKGIKTGTTWFFNGTLVSESDTNCPYSTNTVPSRLVISGPFTISDSGTYTCSSNSTFPTIPPGDVITLSTGSEYGSIAIYYPDSITITKYTPYQCNYIVASM